MKNLPNLNVGDIINLYPDYSWKSILKDPRRAVVNKAIQLYSLSEWGVRSPKEPPTHQGIYVGDGQIFDVTWPVARMGGITEFLGDRRFKVFRYEGFNIGSNRTKVTLLIKYKAEEMVGQKYDWLDLGGFLLHALTKVIGWPAIATKVLPIIFGKTWKLAPFNVLGIGKKNLVCSVGVATILVALHEATGGSFPRPFAVEEPGELDVESHGDFFRAVEAIDPSCVEIWQSEFKEVV
jgi:hypothetical protein